MHCDNLSLPSKYLLSFSFNILLLRLLPSYPILDVVIEVQRFMGEVGKKAYIKEDLIQLDDMNLILEESKLINCHL